MTARCAQCDTLTSEVAALVVERDRLVRETDRLRWSAEYWRSVALRRALDERYLVEDDDR